MSLRWWQEVRVVFTRWWWLIVANASCAALNIALAVFHWHHRGHHGEWVGFACNVTAALFIIAITVWRFVALIRDQRARDHRIIEAARFEHAITEDDRQIANKRAHANLLRVMMMLRTKQAANGDYILESGKYRFRVSSSHIYNTNEGDHTCYQSATMPAEEKIASALLLLHHNPMIWYRWKTDQGRVFV